jgi:dsDNA-specific endonuclease/ATPase MutS2
MKYPVALSRSIRSSKDSNIALSLSSGIDLELDRGTFVPVFRRVLPKIGNDQAPYQAHSSRDARMTRFAISVKRADLRLAEIGQRSLCGKADLQTSCQRL